MWFNIGYNVFCSGLAHLSDGALFLAGGNKDQQLRGSSTHVFNHKDQPVEPGAGHDAGALVSDGHPTEERREADHRGRPRHPRGAHDGGNLRSLRTASLNLPLYPWIDVAPNGRAFYSGPDQTMRGLDTSGTGAWQSFGQRDPIDRSYGGHALFDVGKILVAGGGARARTPASSTSAERRHR